MDIMTHNGQTTNNVYDTGKATTYVYNYEEKMIQVSLTNGVSIVYNYDHEGKRIGKTMNGTTIDYYFDGDDLIIEAQGASILAYYTQGQGLISQRRNNASYFYHYDGLGSTKALTDTNQIISASYVYNLLGEILVQTEAIFNHFKYAGEDNWYKDHDVELYNAEKGWYTNHLTGDIILSVFKNTKIEVCPSWYPDWACTEWKKVKKACGGINAALPAEKIKEKCANCCKTLSDLYSKYDTGNVVVVETGKGPYTRAMDCYDHGCYPTCTQQKSGSLAIKSYSDCSKKYRCIDIANRIIGFLAGCEAQIKKCQEQSPPRPPL